MKAWLKQLWDKMRPTIVPAVVAAVTAILAQWFPDAFKPTPTPAGPIKPAAAIVGPAVVAPGRVAILSTADAGFVAQRWRLINSEQPFELLAPDKVAFATDVPGTYWFVAAGVAKRDKTPIVHAHRLLVDATNPPAPTPTPTPTPVPPDGLAAKLQAAFRTETDVDRANLRTAFAAFYRQWSARTQAAEIQTWGQLFEVGAAAAADAGLTGRLPATQAAIQAHLKDHLPAAAAVARPLDDAGRDLAKRTFAEVATALDQIR